MIIIGLTGSIGMGKSTTAKIFAEFGAQVWDADAAVDRLYGVNGAAVLPIAKLIDNIVTDDYINRDKLRAAVMLNPDYLPAIEKIVHPLVKEDRIAFLNKMKAENEKLIVLDIPLLFEMNGHTEVDYTVVVTASVETQKQRVLARRGMTENRLNIILSKQMPDAVKRQKADYIISTEEGMTSAKEQVKSLLKSINYPE